MSCCLSISVAAVLGKQSDLPYAVEKAYKSLQDALGEAMGEWQVFDEEQQGKVTNAVTDFVSAFCCETRGEAELQDRAALIQTKCGSDRFRKLLDVIFERKDDPEDKNTPILLRSGLLQLIESLEQKLNALPTHTSRPRYEQLLAECKKIAEETNHVEADGCTYLYAIYKHGQGKASDREEAFAGIIQTQNFGKPILEELKSASDSLMDWARRSNQDNLSETKLISGRGNRPGRKKADYKTQQLEAELVAEWERARNSGETKPEFARRKGMRTREFNRLQDRYYQRKRRSDK